jgi:3-hydroxybutyryl-CoA dehydrogenase
MLRLPMPSPDAPPASGDVSPIDSIGVVGGGTMGAGIAEAAALAGCSVMVIDPEPKAPRERLRTSLARAAAAGKLSEDQAAAALDLVHVGTDLEELADQVLVIEAVPEDADLKTEVFRRLDKVTRPDAILASNTSSLPLMKLGSVTQRPDKVVGIHFFNPLPVLPLVELVRSITTSDDTLRAANQFASTTLGKTVIHSKDRAGFIVNALLIPYLLSAVRMLESGFATARDIDEGMVKGCAHPLGPLALCDLIGLDTTAAVARSLYEEFKEPLYAPPPLLQRMVEAGLLGRKAGRGFFEYPSSTGAVRH